MKKIISLTVILCLVIFSCTSKSSETANSSESSQDLALVKKSTNKEAGFVNPGKVESGAIITESTEFGERINLKLTPFIPEYTNFSEHERNMLSSRLNAAVSQVGYGGEGSNPRFIIGPSVTILSQNLTSGAPTLHSVTYEVNFMVADIIDETVFASYTKEFKGVGQTPAKAFINGFRDVNLKTIDFYKFLKDAEGKVTTYYVNNCDKYIAEANAEMTERNFDAAYTILKNIPVEVGECYSEAQTMRYDVFNSLLSLECNKLLQKMKAELGSFNDSTASGYNREALEYYMLIDRESSCYSEAETLYQKYLKGLEPEQKRDWEIEMEQLAYERNHALDSVKTMNNFQIKMKELDTQAEIDGSRKLLEKYESDFYYDRLPWIRRVFHLGELDPFDGNEN